MAFINTKKSLNNLCPTFIDTRNPKYLTVNEYLAASIFVNNYSSEMDGGFLDGLISSNIDFEISMFYEKKNSYETLKELTSYISATGANIKTSSKNQIDIDVMNESYENAKYIKKKMQVDNDDLYYLNIYILTFAKDLKLHG